MKFVRRDIRKTMGIVPSVADGLYCPKLRAGAVDQKSQLGAFQGRIRQIVFEHEPTRSVDSFFAD